MIKLPANLLVFEGGLRLFSYGDNLMFSRILHKRLMEAFPQNKIEVVNTAITAINSLTKEAVTKVPFYSILRDA